MSGHSVLNPELAVPLRDEMPLRSSSRNEVLGLLAAAGLDERHLDLLAAQNVADVLTLHRLTYEQLRECGLSVGDTLRLQDELSHGDSDSAANLAAGLNYQAIVSVILCSMAANYRATYIGELRDYLDGPDAAVALQIALPMMCTVEVLTLYSTFVNGLHAYYSVRRQQQASGLKRHRKRARLATLSATGLFAGTIVLHDAPFVAPYCTGVQAGVAALGLLGILLAAWDFYASGVVRVRAEAQAQQAEEDTRRLLKQRLSSEAWGSSRRAASPPHPPAPPAPRPPYMRLDSAGGSTASSATPSGRGSLVSVAEDAVPLTNATPREPEPAAVEAGAPTI